MDVRPEVGLRVRVRPDDELHRWIRSMGHCDTGRIIDTSVLYTGRVGVRWDDDGHRETIALEHLEAV